jgi:anti-sigma factor RsiW
MTPERRVSEAELHAYVDGELSPQERAAVEAALAVSPEDAELVADLRKLNEALRACYGDGFTGPLPAAMRKQLDRLPRWTAGLATRQAALAASLLVAVGLAAGAAGYFARDFTAGRSEADPAFVINAIGAHRLYVPEVRHPVEVRAAEEHLVRWLTKRVGAPVRAPSLSDIGWKLMGGRLLPDQGQAAAQFMYEDSSGRRLTLYMRKETGLNNTAFRFAESGEFGAFYWIDRPMAYAIAGRLSREDLLTLANAVYAQLEKQP